MRKSPAHDVFLNFLLSAEAKWREMSNILSYIVSQCRCRNIETAVLFVPSEFQYVPEYHSADNPWILSGTRVRSEWLEGDSELQRGLGKWSAEYSVPLYDLTLALRRSVAGGGKLIYRMDGHWNAEGHRVAAKAIAEWLRVEPVFSFLRDESASPNT